MYSSKRYNFYKYVLIYKHTGNGRTWNFNNVISLDNLCTIRNDRQGLNSTLEM